MKDTTIQNLNNQNNKPPHDEEIILVEEDVLFAENDSVLPQTVDDINNYFTVPEMPRSNKINEKDPKEKSKKKTSIFDILTLVFILASPIFLYVRFPLYPILSLFIPIILICLSLIANAFGKRKHLRNSDGTKKYMNTWAFILECMAFIGLTFFTLIFIAYGSGVYVWYTAPLIFLLLLLIRIAIIYWPWPKQEKEKKKRL